MVDSSKGRIFSSGDAKTLYITIPAKLAIDSSFPFEDDEMVLIRIKDGKLILSKEDEDNEK